MFLKPVLMKYAETIIKNIPKNKATGGEMPLHILKQIGFIYQMLTDCINNALSQGIFPDSSKVANITPVDKKDEATDKENCRPVNVLPLKYRFFYNMVKPRYVCHKFSEQTTFVSVSSK